MVVALGLLLSFWPQPLSYDGGGYWRGRAVVEVHNLAETPAKGEIVTLAVGHELPFEGERAESIRVCDELGRELLFDIRSEDGARKKEGTLLRGDRLSFTVSVPPKEKSLFFVYARNPQAWPVAEFLKSGLENGSFEFGTTDPEGWERKEEDLQHKLTWVEGVGRRGRCCVMTEVSPGASPTWVAFFQREIPIRPGASYRFEGWVKARNVKGKAGWFIHVFGERDKWLINRVFDAGEGTFNWRKVEWEFTAPEEARMATVGTVLFGTGAAWFDDVSLTSLDKFPLQVRLVRVEKVKLRRVGGPVRWPQGNWRLRVEIWVRNFDEKPLKRALVAADLRRAIWRLSQWKERLGFVVFDPTTGEVCPHTRLGDNLLFFSDLPGGSEKRFDIFISPLEKSIGEVRYLELLDSPSNLARNPSFEEGDLLPTNWWGDKEASPRRVAEGKVGEFCGRLDIPEEGRGIWLGWRQKVSVEPLRTYLYCGFVKAEGTEGGVRLHAHWHNIEHRLTKEEPMFSTDPEVYGGEGWVFSSALVQSPSEAAFVEFHLTAHVPGTIWHDGIFFGEVRLATRIEKVETKSEAVPKRQRELAVWAVPSLVKVFPDTPSEPSPKVLEVFAARGEWEPLQIALRAGRRLKRVNLLVSPLRGPKGQVLPQPEVWSVGYVKVDHPSAYYSTTFPRWFRFIPRGMGKSDGWAGEWPDPLIPFKPFDIEPGRTKALLLLLHIPEKVRPGTYKGKVKVEAEGSEAIEIPLTVYAWPFSLPRLSRLKVIFDLRNGPGWNVMPDEKVLREWYRLCAQHRLSPGWIQPDLSVRREEERFLIEAGTWDEMAQLCLDKLGINVFYMPFFYAFTWAYKPMGFFGFKPFTPEYEEAYKAGLRALANHLKRRGWLQKCVYYISDEPHYWHKFVLEQMKRLCKLAQEVIPEVPIYSSTWFFVPEWEGYLDIWGVGPQGTCPVDIMEELRRKGHELWFTTDGQMCIDTPYLAIERLLPWLCFKYDVWGYEFWGLSWWTYDPWECGWHRYIWHSFEGEEWQWVRYPNGDGYLTYPGERVGAEGPLPSIRLVQVREGVEDWLLFTMLERTIEEAKREGLDTLKAERALRQVRALVEIPNQGGLRSTDLMPDPEAVLSAREKIGRALAEISSKLWESR